MERVSCKCMGRDPTNQTYVASADALGVWGSMGGTLAATAMAMQPFTAEQLSTYVMKWQNTS